MKKTLAAVAILGAFAGSALADVQVYGLVDLGFGYTHSDDGTDSFAMKSGQDSASRIGFIASEKIGDMTVGVKMENSFAADTGLEQKKDKDNSFFNRETRLFVKGAYGEVGFGRFGTLTSTTGPYNLGGGSMHATTGVASTGDTSLIFLGQDTRRENSVTYKSPTFGGVTVYANYATAEAKENHHEGNRYYAVGAAYKAGALNVQGYVSLVDGADEADGVEKGTESKAYALGASYDFGVTKAFVAAQYFDNAKYDAGWIETDASEQVKGYGFTVGAKTPVVGGVLTTQVGYMDAEALEDKEVKADTWSLAAQYHYPLSKRTTVYAAAGYVVKNAEDGAEKWDDKTFNAGFGMIHNF